MSTHATSDQCEIHMHSCRRRCAVPTDGRPAEWNRAAAAQASSTQQGTVGWSGTSRTALARQRALSRNSVVLLVAVALLEITTGCRNAGDSHVNREPSIQPAEAGPASKRDAEPHPTSAPTPITRRRFLRVVEYDPCKDDAMPRPEIETALDYLARRGSLPPEYRVRAFEWSTGWDVMVISLPAMPGGHITVRLSSDGRVVKLIPGK